MIIYLLCFAIQTVFWTLLFRKLAYYKPAKQNPITDKPISVIICAKNEANNLKNHIPYVLAQDYPAFEIIVVNDHSTDDTLEVLSGFQKKYPLLKIINLLKEDSDRPGKKAALTAGIQASAFETVLLTDADCQPVSNLWIQRMTQSLINENAAISLGYGPFYKAPGFLNKWIRFETILTAIQYFSWALIGKPYMGVGRNLIYQKNLFFSANLKPEIASGDDDLLVQSIVNKKTAIQIDPDSFTYSIPAKTWKEYLIIKFRHISTSFYYNPFFKIILGLFAISQLLFWISFFMLLFCCTKIVCTLLIIKWILQIWIFKKVALKLKEEDLIKHFWWLDFGLSLYYLLLMPGLVFRDKRKW